MKIHIYTLYGKSWDISLGYETYFIPIFIGGYDTVGFRLKYN